MPNSKNQNLFPFRSLTELDLVDISKIIPALEQDVEVQQLKLSVDADADTEARILHVRALLCFLRCRQLGL